MTVYDCIVGVSREIAQSGISKTRSNSQQGYKFRGIDDVLNALSPLLAKYRLVILPRILSRVVAEHTSKSGGVLFYVTVEAEFDFVSAADGSTHTVKTYGEAMDSADKATNKAMSAADKYAAFQTFCIPTEGDNDADGSTHEPVIQIQREITKAEPAIPTTVRGRREVGVTDAPGTVGLPAFQSTVSNAAPSREPGEDDDGFLRVTSVQIQPTKNASVKKALINFSDGRVRSTINTMLINSAEQCRVDGTPVRVTDKKTAWGYDLVSLSRAEPVERVS